MSMDVVEFLLSGFTDNSGNPLAGGKVFTYQAGTTTPKAMYTDNLGVTPETNPIILDSNGKKQVYANGSYKLVIKTSTDVTLYTFDNLFFGNSSGGDTTISLGTATGAANTYAAAPSPAFTQYNVGQLVLFRAHQSNTGAATLNISALGAKPLRKGNGSVALQGGDIPNGSYVLAVYEADNSGEFRIVSVGPSIDGFLDASMFGSDSAAINTAIGLSRNVRVGPGTWTISSELAVTQDYQHLHFEGSILQAAANNINIIHWSSSYGKCDGKVRIDGNAYTGVSALRVSPVDETQTVTAVFNTFNTFEDIFAYSCAEGIVLAAGPQVTGTDSGAWYNRFYNCHMLYCTRGLWFKNSANLSMVTRNQFFACRFGQVGMNVGTHIQSGSSNSFFGCNWEGIGSGTSPIATPTAIYIEHNSSGGGDNNDNKFFGCVIEGCTKDINNDNDFTTLVDCNYTLADCVFTRLPALMSSPDLSNGLFRVGPYILVQGGSYSATYVNGINLNEVTALTGNKEIADYDGVTYYSWTTYPLTTTNMTNTTSVFAYQSKQRKESGMVDWHFRVQFRATVATDPVRINFLTPPDSTVYRNSGSTGPIIFPVVVVNSSGVKAVSTATSSDHVTAPSYIEIPPPSGNWDTSGANQQIHGLLRYHG